jgi:hypothetical protein
MLRPYSAFQGVWYKTGGVKTSSRACILLHVAKRGLQAFAWSEYSCQVDVYGHVQLHQQLVTFTYISVQKFRITCNFLQILDLLFLSQVDSEDLNKMY